MRVFAIGDLHLPSDRAKDMDRFGWKGHPGPLAEAWDRSVGPADLVLLVGDLSWATKSHEANRDFAWIEARPGKKVLIKGNHDHWWGDSYNKLMEFLRPYPSVVGALHAQSKNLTRPVQVDKLVIAGTRGWTAPEAPSIDVSGEMGAEQFRADLVEREAERLKGSLAEAEKLVQATPGAVKLAAMHFPPLYVNGKDTAFSRQIEAWGPQHCVYGHLHSTGRSQGFKGPHGGVHYHLVSCDEANFAPVPILEIA
jgi:predicted phosphohydrolase